MATVTVLLTVIVSILLACLAFEGVNFAGETCECRMKLTNLLNHKCENCINQTYLENFKNRHGYPVDEYCCMKHRNGEVKPDCFDSSIFPYQFCCDRKLNATLISCRTDYNSYPDQVCPRNNANRTCVDGAAIWLWYKLHRGYVPGSQYCCQRPRDPDCLKGKKFGEEFCCTTIGNPCCDELTGCCK